MPGQGKALAPGICSLGLCAPHARKERAKNRRVNDELIDPQGARTLRAPIKKSRANRQLSPLSFWGYKGLSGIDRFPVGLSQ
jgi:hypothetical protein